MSVERNTPNNLTVPVWPLLKFLISGGLIWALVTHVEISPLLDRVSRLEPEMTMLVLLLLALQILAIAVRWNLLCKSIDINLCLRTTCRITLIGQFFNQTLPSSIGGDAVRIWLVARTGARMNQAVATVACDRAIGLVALFSVVAGSLPLFLARVADPIARGSIITFTLSGIGCFLVFLLLGPRLGDLLHCWRYTKPFGTLAHSFHRVFRNGFRTLAVVVLSIMVHLMTVIIAWLCAQALVLPIHLGDCLILVPPVMLLMVVPVSIAGWGVREGAMVMGFAMVGTEAADALALSVAFGLANVVASLPGGMIWLFHRASIPQSLPLETD